jgi:ectoine hydroxylase-related dioxygenase (phytanoyl-CoA dioxygenase family)
MWIAIDDASVDNGTLHVAPGHDGAFAEPVHGSDPHSSLLSCADAIDDDAAMACELAAGGVVFFCYGVPHSTRANRTAESRCAVAYHFITTSEIEQHPGNERENPRGGVRRVRSHILSLCNTTHLPYFSLKR